jgi:hypothetical protein
MKNERNRCTISKHQIRKRGDNEAGEKKVGGGGRGCDGMKRSRMGGERRRSNGRWEEEKEHEGKREDLIARRK